MVIHIIPPFWYTFPIIQLNEKTKYPVLNYAVTLLSMTKPHDSPTTLAPESYLCYLQRLMLRLSLRLASTPFINFSHNNVARRPLSTSGEIYALNDLSKRILTYTIVDMLICVTSGMHFNLVSISFVLVVIVRWIYCIQNICVRVDMTLSQTLLAQ